MAEPEDWNPDKERRETDPVEQAKAVAKAFAEEARRQQDIDRSRSAAAPRPSMDLQMGVHKITNGYVVLWGLAPPGYPAGREITQEAYAANPAEVHATVLRLLREFFEGKLTQDGLYVRPGPFIGGGGPGLGPEEG